MDTNYYNYVEHLKHNMPKVTEKGSIIPIKDEEGLGFKFEDSNDPVYHTFKTVDDYDPRMSNVFTKEDTFLDLHDLELPLDLEDFFTEQDHEVCEKKYQPGDENDSSTSQIVHTDNISWIVHPARSIGTTVTNEDKRGVCIGHIRSNKYKKYFWEYANDTFHEDFIDVMKDFVGYKSCLLYTSPSPRDRG